MISKESLVTLLTDVTLSLDNLRYQPTAGILTKLENGIKTKNPNQSIESYYLLARCFERLQQFDEAIKNFEFVVNRTSDNEKLSYSFYYLAKIYYMKDMVFRSLPLISKVYEIIGEEANTDLYFYMKSTEGKVYASMAMYPEAMMAYDYIIQFKEIAPKSALYSAYIDYGSLFKYMEKFEEGLQMYERAEQILQNHEDELTPNSYTMLYKHKGDLYRAHEDIEEAFALYVKADKYKSLSYKELVSVQNSLASCYVLMKKYSEARSIWTRLIGDERTDLVNKLALSVGLADCSAEQGLIQEAYHILSNAEKSLHEIEANRLILTYYRKLYNWSKKLNQNDKALEYLERKVNIEQIISEDEKSQTIKGIKAINELKLEKKQHEILQIENELNKQKLDMSLVLLKQKNAMLDEIDDFVSALRKDNIQKGKLYTEIHNKIKFAKKANIHEAEVEIKLNESLHEYTKNLREKYKGVTHTEANVAWYLTKGMNTKEIAELMVKEAKTIEQYRYRLRQKLGLTRGEDLEIALSSI